MKEKYCFKHVGRRLGIYGTGLIAALLLIAVGIALLPTLSQTYAAAPMVAANWTTYMGDNARSGYSADAVLNASTATRLKVRWQYKAGGAINVQPIVANNTLYWGAWDGYEYASDLQGKVLWKTYLGTTDPKNPECSPLKAGVASTAALVHLPVNGKNTTALLLGGGDSSFYALDAGSGKILWKTNLGNADTMIWDAPAVYNGSIYIGLASYGDCPLTPGKVLQLNATNGQLQHSFQTVPTGCVGGGVWGAPTIDEVSGTVFVSTGTISMCSKGGEPMAYALIALKASDLSLIGSWQVPGTERGADSDFGSTPTLFNATIQGKSHKMVGLVNKNGIYYALDRDNIKAGPLWQKTMAHTAPGAKSSFSSSAWDGEWLYTGNAGTTINGKKCGGSLRAHDPANGNYLWEYCASGRVVGALTVTPSLVMAGANTDFVVLDSHTGKLLYLYRDDNYASRFWGAPTVANGVIYMGNKDGILYAFSL